MKTVYLAGPIAGYSYQGATKWREEVSREIRLIFSGKIGCLSPMRGKEFLKEVTIFTKEQDFEDHPLASQKGILCRDFYDCTHADMVLVNLLGALEVSIGTMMEVAWAYAHRIPLVVVMEKEGNPHDHAFIREIANFRVDNLKEAVHIIGSILKDYERE